MQDRPVCFQCDKTVETNADMVFESPCGHDECSSAVFHAICLFGWREKRARMMEEAEHTAKEMSNMLERLFKQIKEQGENS